ncbi:MAG: response regulator [Myxococcales bacterium]|nr:response regulator [Myxococcales bacterium]
MLRHPLADRFVLRLLSRRPELPPLEAAMYVRLGVYATMTAAGSALGSGWFIATGRHEGAAIMAAMSLAAVAVYRFARSANSGAAMSRIAHFAVASLVAGTTALSAVAGPVSTQVSAWYLALTPGAAAFLLGPTAVMVWLALIVAALLIAPEWAPFGDPASVYELLPREIQVSQVAMAFVVAVFAGATRRSTDHHVDTLEAHDRQSRQQNTKLQRALQEREVAQLELEAARDAAEQARGAAVRAREVTEHARRLAEEANLAKSRFLANMSHELRTPLNAIIGYSELLVEDTPEDPSEVIADVQNIRRAGIHLLALINELLDLAKIEAGRTELHLERANLPAIVDDVVATAKPLVEANKNLLSVDLQPDLPELWTDAARVKQILLNLVSNAAKFTSSGIISICATAKDGHLSVVVADSGIGMTDEQLSRIFDPFQQADASTTRRFGGTGLGLAIARNFAELLGGTIEADSTPEVGTRFVLSLPVVAEPPTLAIARNPRPSSDDDLRASGARDALHSALIIDDDPAVREIVARHLSRAGLFVLTAPTGEAGVALARERAPSVVFLDVRLPRMDGWAVLSALRSLPETQATPIVILSMVEDRDLAFALGANDYIVKPVDRDKLFGALERAGIPLESHDGP